MTPQDVKKIKKIAFTLIKVGGYALDAIAVAEIASGFRGIKLKKPNLSKVKLPKKEKFKAPKGIS